MGHVTCFDSTGPALICSPCRALDTLVTLSKEICQRIFLKEIISASRAAVIRPKLLRNNGGVTSVAIPLIRGAVFPTDQQNKLARFVPKRNRGGG